MTKHLYEQTHGLTDIVEILVQKDINPNFRCKDRNVLIDRAKGDYCCFVDDDDIVSYDYIPKIINAIQSGPDICAITGVVTSLVDHKTEKFNLSVRHPVFFSIPSDDFQDGIYKRFASHLNPIKTEIIKAVRFPDEKILHEDNIYSQRLKDFRDDWNEVEIDGVIYYYFNRVKIVNDK